MSLPPVITPGQSYSIAENVSSGTNVSASAPTVTDADGPTTTNWMIVSGNTGGAFAINDSTGIISTAAALDRETTSTYTLGLTVRVTEPTPQQLRPLRSIFQT